MERNAQAAPCVDTCASVHEITPGFFLSFLFFSLLNVPPHPLATSLLSRHSILTKLTTFTISTPPHLPPPIPSHIRTHEFTRTHKNFAILEEWQLFSQDFLFLSPPKECCETMNGTLLLDDVHKHKLFVKGFWICDLKVNCLIYLLHLFYKLLLTTN